MELLGATNAATYVRSRAAMGPFLPSISTMRASYRHPAGYNPCVHWRPASSSLGNGARVMTAPSHQHLQMQHPRMPPLASAGSPSASRTALVLSARFTPLEWQRANQGHYSRSEVSRHDAERLRHDTVRLLRDAEQATRRVQAESSRGLGERVGDISFWRAELSHEMQRSVAEMNALGDMKKRVERALAETEGPMQVCKECLYHREKRMGMDMVHDDVEKQLLQEVDVVRRSQEQLRNKLNKINAQLVASRAAYHELERDASDKHNALRIDEKCQHLGNSSEGISFFRGVEQLDPAISVPESWAKFTEDNIVRSQCERAASSKLREDVEATLEVASTNMWQQFNSVNVAFTNRVSETAETKNKLQTHLAKTMQEIFQTEVLIENIKRAIQEKQAPLKVAQTRLEERIRRPNVELCRDAPQVKLMGEVHELQDTIGALKRRKAEAESALQVLASTRAALEHDLGVKANSLFIDRDKCMGMRRNFPSTPRLIGYV
ncbi:tektin-3-like [Lampetra fluviatilis]